FPGLLNISVQLLVRNGMRQGAFGLTRVSADDLFQCRQDRNSHRCAGFLCLNMDEITADHVLLAELRQSRESQAGPATDQEQVAGIFKGWGSGELQSEQDFELVRIQVNGVCFFLRLYE